MNSWDQFWNALYQSIRIGDQVFAFSPMTIFLEFMVPIAALITGAVFFMKWFRRYLAKLTIGDEKKERLHGFMRLGIQLLVGFLVLILGSRFMEERIIKFFENLFGFVTRPLYHAGSSDVSLLTLLLAVPVFYVALLAGKAARHAFEHSKLVSQGIHETRRIAIANIVRYAVMAAVLLLGLSIIGLDLSSVGIFLGVLGIGVGIGLQQVLVNFFAGLFLVMVRPVQEKDYIVIEDKNEPVEGEVLYIRMLNTVLVSRSYNQVIVPNSRILNGVVRNFSSEKRSKLLESEFSVSTDSDLEALEKSLLESVVQCPGYSNDIAPVVRILSFGTHELQLCIQLRIVANQDLFVAKDWLNRLIWKLLRKDKNPKLK